MLLKLPTVQENGLIELHISDLEELFKPFFEHVIPKQDRRAFLITEAPPRMVGNEWFGQGVYCRHKWNNRYAVIELDDNFLIVPEGTIDKVWRQEKLGVKRFCTVHTPRLTFMGRDLVEGLSNLNNKYARNPV